MTKGHMVHVQPSHPIFSFLFKNETHNLVGQPKGTSSREVKLVLWRAYHLHFICFPLSVSMCRVWLLSTFVCPLKEDGLPTSLAATWTSFWRSFYRRSKYLIHQIFRIFCSHEIFVRTPHLSIACFREIHLKLTVSCSMLLSPIHSLSNVLKHFNYELPQHIKIIKHLTGLIHSTAYEGCESPFICDS